MTGTLEIHIYKAECGDAFRFTFVGDDNKIHHILLDAGYERTFRDSISHDLKRIETDNEFVDLWIISHIHDDHIGGAINYANAVKKQAFRNIVNKWWYNPPRFSKNSVFIQGASFAASIGQGDDLANYLKACDMMPSEDIVHTLAPVNIDKVTVTILSPSETELAALRNKYSQPGTKLEKNEDFSPDSATYVKPRDYNTLVESFDLSEWSQDKNAENGSSIAVLLQMKQHCSLWLADSFSLVVVAKLRELGYSENNRLACDLVKVSHHGCDENNSDSLYTLIDCQHFIISSDGRNKHALPNKKTLVRILKNPGRDRKQTYHFYFPYDDPVLRSIFDIDETNIYEKLNFRMHFGTVGFNL